ncbi:hypothetical protein [Actinomadura fibrosa]|uniref:SAM-dependent methyltransferase n=1 Tax=Actinomadura fibrosa TaxID=111802 RepID=A0ABW2Y6F1_9ACTN|nr:hypothetical protein [Actinomadura fibrosa]
MGFHVGDESILETTGDGDQSTQVYVYHRQPSRVADWLREAGFTIEAQHLLNPDQTKPGAILFARRPAAPPR